MRCASALRDDVFSGASEKALAQAANAATNTTMRCILRWRRQRRRALEIDRRKTAEMDWLGPPALKQEMGCCVAVPEKHYKIPCHCEREKERERRERGGKGRKCVRHKHGKDQPKDRQQLFSRVIGELGV
eukprot:scaffold873_cov252-Pinguiococcus_pyrenoidosus.AAC.20